MTLIEHKNRWRIISNVKGRAVWANELTGAKVTPIVGGGYILERFMKEPERFVTLSDACRVGSRVA